MAFKDKTVILCIEGIEEIEQNWASLFGDPLDSIIKDSGIQFLLNQEGFNLFETITRITHIVTQKSKHEPKSYMVRKFFSTSSKTFEDMFNCELVLCTNNEDLIINQCKEYKINEVTYVSTSDEILDSYDKFMQQDTFPLFYIHLDMNMYFTSTHSELESENSKELPSDIWSFMSNFINLVDLSNISLNIILSPITNCEEKDFNPPVQEDSIVASIIPQQTFYTYMNQPVEIDFSQWSLLIQYDLGVVRRLSEFDTLEDVFKLVHQRNENYGMFKGKTFLGDNFMMEIMFKLAKKGKFGA